MIRGALVALVRLYQLVVSPMLPRSCRFFPSCSQYMIDAITLHGPFRGVWMGVKRILRCQPLCKGGFDWVKVERESD